MDWSSGRVSFAALRDLLPCVPGHTAYVLGASVLRGGGAVSRGTVRWQGRAVCPGQPRVHARR